MWIPGLTTGPRTQEFKQEQNEQGPGYWHNMPRVHCRGSNSNRVVGKRGRITDSLVATALRCGTECERGAHYTEPETVPFNRASQKGRSSSEVRSHRLHHQPNSVQGGPGNHPQAYLYLWSPGSPGEDIHQNPNNPSPRDSELKQKKEN